MNPWLCNLLFNNSGGSSLPVTGQTFYASLKTSLVPEVGTGAPTWSRATTAWRFNDIGLLRQIPSGCAEFGGARLVTNQVGASEAVNGSAWTKSNCTAGSATTLVCASGTSLQRMYSATAYAFAVGEKWDFCARLTYVDHPYVQIRGHGSISSGVANFDILNGTYTIAGSADSASMTLVSAGVYDCRVRISTTGAATAAAPTVSFVSSTAAAMDATFAGDGVKSFGITRIQSVNVTGRDASYIPEYVSVGSDTNKNFFTHTDDFSQSAWSKTNVNITQAAIANPINGLVNAQKVEASSSTTTSLSYISSTVGRVEGNIFVVYVKQGSGVSDANSFLIRNYTSSTNLVSITLNYSTGNITYVTGSTGASAVNVGGGWWRVTLVVTSGISANDQLRPYIGFVGGSETINEFCYVYRPYLGCGITAPDIIPVVSAAWDAHGAGTDGCKYFATDTLGAPIPVANLTRLRKESSATNALLWSRDLSNAAWSTKTNITVAKTATGLDGIANTATTLTATAADAIILQPTSGIASAARCASTYVLRKTGTGTISFTQDGGSTWTDITSLINSSTWSRVQITSTLANPSIGFKISTSGDAIDVDCMQNEAGSVATSPIVTTTTTVNRNADVLTYQTSGNIDFTAGTIFSQCRLYGMTTGSAQQIIRVSTNGYMYVNNGDAPTNIRAFDGVTVVTKTGLDDITSKMAKRAVSWGGATMVVSGNGLVSTQASFDGGFGDGASITVGNAILGYIGDVAIYNYKMTDAELQAITT